jgi:putative RecB family exonuclease
VAGPAPALRTVSYSRLSSFESCPRQFWHAYVDKTPPDGYDRIEGWMGSLVHKTLEWALRETLQKRVPDPVAVLDAYEAAWEAEYDPARVAITKDGYDAEHYRRVGRTCLKDHLDAEWPFLRHHPVSVEERVGFDVDFGNGPSRFLGYVDRVDRPPDGRVRVVDYKTGGWVPDVNDPANARQLALYWHALKPKHRDASEAVLVWHYLQSGTTLRVEATDEVVEPAVGWVNQTGQAIQKRLDRDASKRAFAASPGPLCRWCPYGYTCDENPYQDTARRPARAHANATLRDFDGST